MMLTEPPNLLALQPVKWLDSITTAEFDSVWSYKKFTAPPFDPLATQLVNVDVVNVTGLVAELMYSTSIDPPRFALQLVATTVVAINALDVTTPFTCADNDPPYPVAVHVVNVTSVNVTGDIDATPLPYDRYSPPPLPPVDTQFVNVVGEAADAPLTVNCVVDPGTTIDTHPPLLPDCPFANVFDVSVNDDKSLVAAPARILTAPPKLPAWLPLNIDPEIVVAIFVYVPAVNEIDPPLDPAPALHPVNVLPLTLTADDEYDAE